MSKAQSSRLQSCTVGTKVYTVGDTVLVRGTDSYLPYIGKIKEIALGSSKNEKCLMAWFYRPEEAEGGRKQFHGERELFRSDHVDWVNANTITDACQVHSLKTYQTLKEVESNDFFTRFTYQPATKEFKPDRVPVYCVCEMPYNPDQFMVMCTRCEEWYHPKCLGFDHEHIESMPDFICQQRGCAAAEEAANDENGEEHVPA